MTLLLAVLALVAALWLATLIWPEQAYRLGVRGERSLARLCTCSATVDGFHIPYLDGGKGEPLVLIHGFAGDKDNFTRCARFLTPHYRGAHGASVARSGFSCYRGISLSVRGRSGRAKGRGRHGGLAEELWR